MIKKETIQNLLISGILMILTNLNALSQITYLDDEWKHDYGITFNNENSDFVLVPKAPRRIFFHLPMRPTFQLAREC